MFVQTADDLKADDKTLRLVNVGQQTRYFSDRPARIAGHITMPAYLDEWKAGAVPDNFANDPPNMYSCLGWLPLAGSAMDRSGRPRLDLWSPLQKR
jgi:hypothetical protein